MFIILISWVYTHQIYCISYLKTFFFFKGELHEKLLSIIFHLLFIFSVTIYFEGGWRILSLSHSQLAQATEMLYMRLDTMNTTCVDR